MIGALFVVTLVTALGSGLVAGVFFAFSTFVMAALRRLPPARGIVAMQSVNVLAVTPAFMMLLFGTAVASLALIVWLAAFASIEHAWLVIGGGIVYLIGSIGVRSNDRLQCSAQRTPRDDETAGSRRPGVLAVLRSSLDALEPRSLARIARCGDDDHRRTLRPVAC
jgi:hypothetical protein